LEVTEDFISEATGLPSTGQKWFKNSKIEEVTRGLFMTSRKIDCCEVFLFLCLRKSKRKQSVSDVNIGIDSMEKKKIQRFKVNWILMHLLCQ